MELTQLVVIFAWIPLAAAFAARAHRHEPVRIRQAIPTVDQLPLKTRIRRR
jgi:hypothetical protein